MSLENPFIQIAIGIILSLCLIGGIILLEQKYKVDNPQCVMTRLTQSSIIICTYKDKVLFNGEVNE